mmetsp:Transcript_40996/g.39532  ORF Transcript_40996/g.39532 Transcript_40996/m.39532 type:complete len:87 (+) Transcript_40996:103-363(+)
MDLDKQNKIKERKEWQELIGVSKDLTFENDGINKEEIIQNNLNKDWNKSCEHFYRNYKKGAKQRMNTFHGSNRDRYNDVATLAFRK